MVPFPRVYQFTPFQRYCFGFPGLVNDLGYLFEILIHDLSEMTGARFLAAGENRLMVVDEIQAHHKLRVS